MSALMTLSDVAMRFPLASDAGEQQHVVFSLRPFVLPSDDINEGKSNEGRDKVSPSDMKFHFFKI